MKIKTIEFENFRNFKNHGLIRCSIDGKVTIVYGKNGDGKTTLHQLFRWVFYGQVHFNKTTTDRLYNLEFENNASFGDVFDVMGRIEFEHDGSQYSLTRKFTYKKALNKSDKIAEDLSLLRLNGDKDWKPIDKPKDVIEKLIPSGLSDYFFFDGESMIADLRVKGKDSAGKLRKALYSMFDLDVTESAINHIGRTDLKTTVLGKLYLSKGTISSSSEIAAVKTNIEGAQSKLEKIAEQIQKAEEEKNTKKEFVSDTSEKIGSTKSKEEYEKQRKALKAQRDIFINNAEMAQSGFGDAVFGMFPQLFISKAVSDARGKIHLKVSDNKLPAGVNYKLIKYLLSNDTNECICGNPLCESEREHIKEYLDMLPPKSFTSLYNEFTTTARNWGEGLDKEKIQSFIQQVLDNREQAQQCDTQILELDNAEKKSPDIEDLVIARRQAEVDIESLEQELSDKRTEQKKFEIYLKKQMSDFDQLTKATSDGELILKKIRIMEQVADYFRKKLETESVEYSLKLQSNIQSLIDDMLTSKRKVSVSAEFSVTVTDSYNDESKSEGQFAVVSFAYIGGILKMLQSEAALSSKEYPLVLDGPFSKLDPDQRQNVIDMIPQFAPQVILFSKDDLHELFPESSIGKTWTIVSNEEKNVAHVEEGYLWK